MFSTASAVVRFLFVAFFISIFCVFSFFFVQAQEGMSTAAPALSITDASAVPFESGSYIVSFRIDNDAAVQPDLVYGVLLTQTTQTGEVVADERSFGTAALTTGDYTIPNFVYTPSPVLDGTYTLSIVARTSDGFVLLREEVTDITLTRSAQYGAYIDPTTCSLTVSGASQETYPYGQIPTINPGDTLVSRCMVQNIGSADLELMPITQTYRRSVFGAAAGESGVFEPVPLKSGEVREIVTELPTVSEPQTYAVRLLYGYTPSNAIQYQYVVAGTAASIEQVTLDSDRWSAGDTSRVSLTWVPSGTLSSPNAFITIADAIGVRCGEPVLYPLLGATEHTIDVPITKDCVDPVVSLAISDSDTGILAEHTYTLTSAPVTDSANVSAPVSGMPVWVYVLLVLALVLFIVLAFVFLRKGGNTPAVSVAGPLALLLITGAVSIGSSYSLTSLDGGVQMAAARPGYCVFLPAIPVCRENPEIPDSSGPEVGPNTSGSGESVGGEPVAAGSLSVEPCEIAPGNFHCTATVLFKSNVSATVWVSDPAVDGGAERPAFSESPTAISWADPTLALVLKTEGGMVLDGVSGTNIAYCAHNGTYGAGGPCSTPTTNPDTGTGTGTTPGGTGTTTNTGTQGTGGGSPTLTVQPCTIPLLGSTCSIPGGNGAGVSVSGIQGYPGAALYVVQGNNKTLWSGVSPSETYQTGAAADWVRPTTEIALYDATGTTLLAGPVTGLAQCAQGSRWDANAVRCVAAPPTNDTSPVVQFCGSNDTNCPSISASGVGVGSGQWDGFRVLHNQTLSLSVSGLSSAGAEMCQVFRIHPNGAYVPSPLTFAQQYCTYESHYSPVTVSANGVAQIDIPQVNPEYAIDAVYQVCFKNNSAGSKAACKYVTVTPYGMGGVATPTPRPGSCPPYGGPAVSLRYSEITTSVYNIDEPVPLILSAAVGIEPIQFSLTVTDPGAGVAGNSVSLDRTSGTFTPGAPGSDNGVIANMTVRGTPRTVHVSLTANASGPSVVQCGGGPFVTGASFNLAYPGVGETYQCVGTRPEFHQTHGGANRTNVPNKPWTYKPVSNTGGLSSCEFKCLDGYKWSNPNGNLWSDGSCVPDNVTPQWSIKPATGAAPVCTAWQESQKQFARDGHPCNTDQADRFYHACDSIDGKQYRCVLPDGAEAPGNTWSVSQNVFLGGIYSVSNDCPGSYSPDMAGRSCSQPGFSCKILSPGSNTGTVYTCDSTTPSIGVGRVLDYQTGAPISGVKVYRPYSAAVMVGFDDGQCTATDASGGFRIGINNKATAVNHIQFLSGTPAGIDSQAACYNSDYVYWDGGTVYHDQATLTGGERIIPVEDILVRRVEFASTSAGTTVAKVNQPDLVSSELSVPPTAIQGADMTIAAMVVNQGDVDADVSYQNTFAYRWNDSTEWNTLAPINKNGLKSGESSEDKITFAAPSVGRLWVRHCVDISNTLAEFTEENNCTESTFPVEVRELTYVIDEDND